MREWEREREGWRGSKVAAVSRESIECSVIAFGGVKGGGNDDCDCDCNCDCDW